MVLGRFMSLLKSKMIVFHYLKKVPLAHMQLGTAEQLQLYLLVEDEGIPAKLL